MLKTNLALLLIISSIGAHCQPVNEILHHLSKQAYQKEVNQTWASKLTLITNESNCKKLAEHFLIHPSDRESFEIDCHGTRTLISDSIPNLLETHHKKWVDLNTLTEKDGMLYTISKFMLSNLYRMSGAIKQAS